MEGQLRLPAELHAPLTAQAEISRLRAQGYTAADIARSLNAGGVPTPSGRGRWWPATVQYHGFPGVKARRDRYIADYRARQRLQRVAGH